MVHERFELADLEQIINVEEHTETRHHRSQLQFDCARLVLARAPLMGDKGMPCIAWQDAWRRSFAICHIGGNRQVACCAKLLDKHDDHDQENDESGDD